MKKRQIIQQANEKTFFLRVIIPVKGSNTPKEDFKPAKLSGANLDFPIIHTKEGHQAEISWNMAERIVKGELINIY